MSEVKFGFTAKQIIDNGRTTQENIELLKTWLKTQSYPKLTDEQIVLFLVSCNNDQEAAQMTIKTHYDVKIKAPEMFNNRKLERMDLQKSLEVAHLCILPERTDDGCAILVIKLYDTDYRKSEMMPYLMNLCMATDVALYDNPPTRLIIICDLQGMSLMHLTKIKLGLFRTYLQYLQSGLALKLKNIHLLNTFYVLEKLHALAKPFLKREVAETIVLHPKGMDMELFYKNYIPQRCLPKDYGGDLPSVEVIQKEHVQKVKDLQSFFNAEEDQRRSISK